MRIAYITAGAGGTICGNCLEDNALAAALKSQGHDVLLIPTYTPIRTDEIDVSEHRVYYGGVNVYLQQKYPLFRHTPRFLDRLFDVPALLRQVSKLAVKTLPQDLGEMTVAVLQGSDGPIAKELDKLIDGLRVIQPDLVHLTNSMLVGFAPAIRDRLRIPVVCSLQGEDFFLANLPPPYSEEAFSTLRRKASAASLFVAPCRDHAEAMARRLEIDVDEIAVVRSGIQVDDFAPAASRNENEFSIGYLARVAPEKGLLLLAEAVHQLLERRGDRSPRIRLRAAGWLSPEHIPFLQDVERHIERWGFSDRFEYEGYIDRGRKTELLRELDVLSTPAEYAAPKGLYVMEAWASGVPVVQPRIGVFPELLEETAGGILVEPSSPSALADGIERLIENRAEARAMGERGRAAAVERYSVDRMASETAALYRNLLNSRTRIPQIDGSKSLS